jgi:hypothetical protein
MSKGNNKKKFTGTLKAVPNIYPKYVATRKRMRSSTPQRSFSQRASSPSPYGLSQGRVGMTPQFASGRGMNELIFTHREFIMDVAASNSFTNVNLVINVGNPVMFPILSQIALNFDQYELYGLQFHYRSVSSDNVVATSAQLAQLGTVMMAINYNANATAFTTKQQFMEYDNAVSGKISTDIKLNADVSPRNVSDKILYTSTGVPPFGEDNKTYNIGVLNIGVNGSGNIGECGELWVSYSVRLLKPKLFSGIGNNLECAYTIKKATATLTDLFGSLTNSDVVYSNLPYKTILNGNSLPSTSNGIINNLIIWTSASRALTIRFPDFIANRVYQIELIGTGTADSGVLTTGSAVSSSANITLVDQLYDGAKSAFFAGVNSTNKSFKLTTLVHIREAASSYINVSGLAIIAPNTTQTSTTGSYILMTLPTTYSYIGSTSFVSLKITQVSNNILTVTQALSTVGL